jgi:hypothetical protein
MTMNHSKANHIAFEATERQRQAVELRKAGVSFVQIAERLGYADHSGAYRAVTAALKKTLKEPAEAVREMELARLDAMILGVWPRARSGDDAAIRSMLRIMERRAAYLGLDAPVKREITLHDYTTAAAKRYGLDPKEVLAEAERIIAELSG